MIENRRWVQSFPLSNSAPQVNRVNDRTVPSAEHTIIAPPRGGTWAHCIVGDYGRRFRYCIGPQSSQVCWARPRNRGPIPTNCSLAALATWLRGTEQELNETEERTGRSNPIKRTYRGHLRVYFPSSQHRRRLRVYDSDDFQVRIRVRR